MNNNTASRIVIIVTLIILLMSTSAMAVGRSDRIPFYKEQPALSQNRLNTSDFFSRPLVLPMLALSNTLQPSSGTENTVSRGIIPIPVPSSEKSDLSSRVISRPSRIPSKYHPTVTPNVTPTVTPTPIIPTSPSGDPFEPGEGFFADLPTPIITTSPSTGCVGDDPDCTPLPEMMCVDASGVVSCGSINFTPIYPTN
jgi:hypothetical protein